MVSEYSTGASGIFKSHWIPNSHCGQQKTCLHQETSKNLWEKLNSDTASPSQVVQGQNILFYNWEQLCKLGTPQRVILYSFRVKKHPLFSFRFYLVHPSHVIEVQAKPVTDFQRSINVLCCSHPSLPFGF